MHKEINGFSHTPLSNHRFASSPVIFAYHNFAWLSGESIQRLSHVPAVKTGTISPESGILCKGVHDNICYSSWSNSATSLKHECQNSRMTCLGSFHESLVVSDSYGNILMHGLRLLISVGISSEPMIALLELQTFTYHGNIREVEDNWITKLFGKWRTVQLFTIAL